MTNMMSPSSNIAIVPCISGTSNIPQTHIGSYSGLRTSWVSRLSCTAYLGFASGPEMSRVKSFCLEFFIAAYSASPKNTSFASSLRILCRILRVSDSRPGKKGIGLARYGHAPSMSRWLQDRGMELHTPWLQGICHGPLVWALSFLKGI